jgi:hypothetical protein
MKQYQAFAEATTSIPRPSKSSTNYPEQNPQVPRRTDLAPAPQDMYIFVLKQAKCVMQRQQRPGYNTKLATLLQGFRKASQAEEPWHLPTSLNHGTDPWTSNAKRQ